MTVFSESLNRDNHNLQKQMGHDGLIFAHLSLIETAHNVGKSQHLSMFPKPYILSKFHGCSKDNRSAGQCQLRSKLTLKC